MEPIIHHLFRDHARRTWGLWLFGSLSYLGAACAFLDNNRSTAHWPYFLFFSLLIVSSHINQLPIRYLPPHDDLVLLPLPQHSLGRFLWWARIGFPGLIVTAITFLAFVGTILLGGSKQTFEEVFLWLLMPWGLLGFQPFIPISNRLDSALLWIFGVTPSLMYVAAFVIHGNSPLLVVLPLTATGISAVLYGFSHPERFRLLRKFAAQKDNSTTDKHHHRSINSRLPNPWIKVFALCFVNPLAGCALLSLAALVVFNDSINKFVVSIQLAIILSLAATPGKRMVDVIQELRGMPITPPKSAAIIYGMTISPTLSICVVGLALIPTSDLHQYVFTATIIGNWALLSLPMSIMQRFEDDELVKITPFFFWIAATATAVFVTFGIAPQWIRLGLTILLVVVVAVGYKLTILAIKRMGRDKLRNPPQFKGEN